MRAGATGSTVYFSGSGLTGFALRQVERLGGFALLAAAAAGVGALATWNVADPSFSHSTDNPVTNALGYGGAVYSDLAMQFFGLSALVTLVPLVAWGLLFATARGVDRMAREIAAVNKMSETEAVRLIEANLAKGPKRGAKADNEAEAEAEQDEAA